ncbi:hypothetical protein FNV43_RR17707 [Rhamnella rubrinervis]|uniref:Uncharacterized protein n=1 Tax=Rhamnella rubrinervis TaxID=2594499 RepID=A0A8K0E4R6_9ROSA|nr:hypothetical protein FNV43_RR17707 [Rhamnella rubrinervis]
MALRQFIISLVFALAFANVDLSTCTTQILKAKVSCLDCKANYDLSGIKILVKCEQVKKLGVAITENDGSFEAELPADHTPSPTPLKCLAKLLGGPKQLYAPNKLMVSQIIHTTHDSNSYSISTPLAFYTSCPSAPSNQAAKCKAMTEFASSKTVDLPLPPEWGLAPSSYYVPFFPIIGIP